MSDRESEARKRHNLISAITLAMAVIGAGYLLSETISTKIQFNTEDIASRLSTPENTLAELEKIPSNVSHSSASVEFHYANGKYKYCSSNILTYDERSGVYVFSTAGHCLYFTEDVKFIKVSQPQFFGNGFDMQSVKGNFKTKRYYPQISSNNIDFGLFTVKSTPNKNVITVGIENIQSGYPKKDSKFVASLYPGQPNNDFNFISIYGDLRTFRVNREDAFSITNFYAEPGSSGGGLFVTDQYSKSSVGKLYGVVLGASGADQNTISILPAKKELAQLLRELELSFDFK